MNYESNPTPRPRDPSQTHLAPEQPAMTSKEFEAGINLAAIMVWDRGNILLEIRNNYIGNGKWRATMTLPHVAVPMWGAVDRSVDPFARYGDLINKYLLDKFSFKCTGVESISRMHFSRERTPDNYSSDITALGTIAEYSFVSTNAAAKSSMYRLGLMPESTLPATSVAVSGIWLGTAAALEVLKQSNPALADAIKEVM